MKKHINFASIAFLAISTIIISCKKDEPVAEEHEHAATATITITEPTADSTYEMGQSVNLNVDITGSSELHGYQVLLINETAVDTIIKWEVHEHNTTYAFDSTWINNVTAHSSMSCKVRAFIDHDGNYTDKSVSFHCHPM